MNEAIAIAGALVLAPLAAAALVVGAVALIIWSPWKRQRPWGRKMEDV